MKLNYMRMKKNVLTWRQVERRDGRTFMRMKSRPYISVRGPEKGVHDERIC